MSEITANVGIVGTHIEQSLSPVMHNAAYREMGLDLYYGRFQLPKDIKESSERQEYFASFLDEQAEHGVIGLSVTMPFKLDAISNERVSRGSGTTMAIGAANTLSHPRTGIWYPDNTDWRGAVLSLEETGINIDGSTALILGAGGTARAVAFGLIERGVEQITFANRTYLNAEALVRELGAVYTKTHFVSLDIQYINYPSESTELILEESDIIFNTTNIGQDGTSGEDLSPIQPSEFRRICAGTVIEDAVYMPVETKLLQLALARGDLRVVNGTRMLLHQAVEQVKIFTGEDDVPIDVMDAVLKDEMLKRAA